MMLGLSLEAFTLVHVLISLIGIASGLVVLYGWLERKRLNGWTAVFLLTTVLTSVTGFMFPFDHVLPSHKVGILSLVLLAVAIAARYGFKMAGHWRWVYVVTAGLSLYLNAFVGVVQSFLKIPVLHSLAPNQTEPAFAVAQLGLLVISLALIVLSVIRFRPVRL